MGWAPSFALAHKGDHPRTHPHTHQPTHPPRLTLTLPSTAASSSIPRPSVACQIKVQAKAQCRSMSAQSCAVHGVLEGCVWLRQRPRSRSLSLEKGSCCSCSVPCSTVPSPCSQYYRDCSCQKAGPGGLHYFVPILAQRSAGSPGGTWELYLGLSPPRAYLDPFLALNFNGQHFWDFVCHKTIVCAKRRRFATCKRAVVIECC